MKILIVHYRYFITGGPERYLFNIKSALEKRGCEIIPFSIKTSHNISSKYESYFAENIGHSDSVYMDNYPKNIKVYWDLIFREFYSFRVKKKLKKLIKDTRPDICYLLAYKRTLSPSVIDACAELNIPIVNRLSDYNSICGAAHLYRDGYVCDNCVKGSKKNCFTHRCMKGSTLFSLMRYLSILLHQKLHMDNKISNFICTNEFMRIQMHKDGYAANKLKLLPTFFHETEETVRQRSENVLSDKIKFLFIGTLDEKKGLYDLLEVLASLKQNYSNFLLNIVGGVSIQEQEKVKRLISEKQLEKYITFEPFRNDGNIFSAYKNANVVVLPSRIYENLPNTLIESIYFQRPVIVPDFGSFSYTVDDNVSFKYTALSLNSLKQVMQAVLEHPASILEKSKKCNAFFQKNYSEKSHLEKLTKIFNETIISHNKRY